MKEDPPEFVAAVDLGSNSFHMTVARVDDGRIHIVDRIKEMVRLAAGLNADNELEPDVAERALACLERFGERLRELPRGNVRAVGTNTLRRAKRSVEFLRAAEEALGHSIEIIAGREEARLIYLGVAHDVAHDEEQRLVMDIGGGSTEFVIGRRFTPLHLESLYMGCVGLSQRYFADGRLDKASVAAAELSARQELEPIQARYRRAGWDEAVGASGTILTAGALLGGDRGEDGITLAGLYGLREKLLEAGHVDRLSLPGLQPERAPVFPGGLAILVASFEALGIKRMHCSDWALREGILFDLIGRFRQTDVRDKTIADLSGRYRVDQQQADRVERTALELRAQVAKSWKLRKEKYGDLLGWAARLHELGLAIAHNQYHKHGAYVLAEGDLPGFSRQEQALLALLVRSHRRKFPVALYRELPVDQAERAVRLAVLLRLSVVLHRGRSDSPLPGIIAEADDLMLRLEFPGEWLEEHPLTVADLEQEASFLRAARITLKVT